MTLELAALVQRRFGQVRGQGFDGAPVTPVQRSERGVAQGSGSVLLIWIAVKLVIPERQAEEHLIDSPAATSLWSAVRIVMVADAVMSLDNVLAVAAAAKGSVVLLVLGIGNSATDLAVEASRNADATIIASDQRIRRTRVFICGWCFR